MGSKAFLILWFCLAICFMISSEVVSRDLAETSATTQVVNLDGRRGYNSVGGFAGSDATCPHGFCCGGRFNQCRCCSYAEAAKKKAAQAKPLN